MKMSEENKFMRLQGERWKIVQKAMRMVFFSVERFVKLPMLEKT